ncbi:efflux RND transporter periplasmic adaptor subunit [Calycomorphotria hydatis]|nr:efflux RND transporter periplasmic adaptor subunit [Calycomorphotria hydatis]
MTFASLQPVIAGDWIPACAGMTKTVACAGMTLLLFSAMATAAEPIRIESAFVRLNREVDLPALEAGVLQQVATREGDLVDLGQLLARIDDRTLMLAREQARIATEIARAEASDESQLEFAERAYEVAKSELQRANSAREKVAASVSLSEIDRLRLDADRMASDLQRITRELQVARMTADLRQSELKATELRLDNTRIQSPMTGMIVEHYKEEGEWVEPGDAVFRVLELDTLRVEGFLQQSLLPKNILNAPVEVVTPTGEAMEGRIVFVDPEIEPTTGEVRLRALVQNPEFQLKPGTRVTMLVASSDNTDGADE